MTHEEQALVRILKQVKTADQYWVSKWYKHAQMCYELQDPIDESPETVVDGATYFCRREAYIDGYEGGVYYGYTLYKWDGTYIETKLSPESKKTFKWKNWVEIFHTHTEKKNDPKDFIKFALYLIENGRKLDEKIHSN